MSIKPSNIFGGKNKEVFNLSKGTSLTDMMSKVSEGVEFGEVHIDDNVSVKPFSYGLSIYDRFNPDLYLDFDYDVLATLDNCSPTIINLVIKSLLLNTFIVKFRAEGVYDYFTYKNKVTQEFLEDFCNKLKKRFNYEYFKSGELSDEYLRPDSLDCIVYVNDDNKTIIEYSNLEIVCESELYEYLVSLDENNLYEVVSSITCYHLFELYGFNIPKDKLELVTYC